MMINQKQIIEDELKRRLAIRDVIKKAVNEKFILTDSTYTRRGIVHKHIADYMGVCQSNMLAREVFDYMKSEGVQNVMIHGRAYYKNICDKTFCVTLKEIIGLDERF